MRQTSARTIGPPPPNPKLTTRAPLAPSLTSPRLVFTMLVPFALLALALPALSSPLAPTANHKRGLGQPKITHRGTIPHEKRIIYNSNLTP